VISIELVWIYFRLRRGNYFDSNGLIENIARYNSFEFIVESRAMCRYERDLVSY